MITFIYKIKLVLQWLWVITLAVLYNVLFVVGRATFWELEGIFPTGADLLCTLNIDLLYFYFMTYCEIIVY